jgi:hypothetical protein
MSGNPTLVAISNNAGVVKYCFVIFLTFFAFLLFFGAHYPPRSHERCLATAENLVSRERSQGRSGDFSRTVHRRPLTPRTAHHHWHRTKRKLRLAQRFCFGSALLADLTACHHPPKARRVICRELQFDPTISPIKTSTMITTSNSLTFVRERGAQSIGR